MTKLGLIFLAILTITLCSWVKEEVEAPTYKAFRRFVFKNQCKQKIWVGGFGVPLPSKTGWEMASGAQ